MIKNAVKVCLSVLLFTAFAQAETPSPCYWSGQLTKCFPTTGLFLDNSKTLRLGTDNLTNYVELAAPTGMSGNLTFTWPSTVGSTGQVLSNLNGTGALTWAPDVGFANPMTTTGDIIYASNTATPATPARLGIGAGTTVLHGGTIPSYSAVSLTADVTGTLPIGGGGTGQTTATTAFNALSPLTTAGDVLYGAASGAGTRLAAGSATTLLHSGTTPSWSAVSLTADITGTLGIGSGGTGQTTKAPAFDALSPLTTAGDVLYGGASGTGTRLAAGGSTTVLHSGTTPSWAAVSLTGDITGTLGIGNGGTGQTTKAPAFDALSPMTTAGDIIYGGTAGTGTRLGIGAATTVLHGGTTTPAYSQIVDADVSSSAAIAGSKIASASASVAGVVDTATQTMAGAKTWNDAQTWKYSSGGTTAGSYDTNGSWVIGRAGASSYAGVKAAGATDGNGYGAGYRGEVIKATDTNNITTTPTILSSITLTPGNWLVWAGFYSGDTGAGTSAICGITTASTTTLSTAADFTSRTAAVAANQTLGGRVGPVVANITASTVYNIVCTALTANFNAGNEFITGLRL